MGLIAGLTIPSVIASVEKSKNKALMKESIQAITEIVQGGVLNGDFSSMSSFDIQSPNSPLVEYFTTRLNARNCAKDVLTPPCDHALEYTTKGQSYNNHAGRWVLNNGVKIWFDAYWHTTTYLNFFIDTKPTGDSKYAVVDGDQLWIFCNVSDSPVVPNNASWYPSPLKPSQCAPPVRMDYVGQYNALFN